MGIDRTRRVTFEEVADLYNEVRAGYPAQLVEDIISLSGIPEGGKILEIGCGPGNATLPFAQRGYNILAVELGERLAEYARARCRDFPKVKIVCSEFEPFPLEEKSLDLVLSADAFHWIVPEIGYPKAFRTLKESGALALFWQVPVDPHTEWSQAIDRVYQKIAPQFDNPNSSFTLDWLRGIILDDFKEYTGVENVMVKSYEWTETISAENYIKLLRTYSSHRDMDEVTRAQLYAEIRNVFHRFGDQVEQPRRVALFLARSDLHHVVTTSVV